ncbi:hypothetical protein NKH77_56195 [Streptomyces sp. M19]
MIETDGLAHAVVTVYREHPLINIREATAEDLTMGPDGRIAVGLRHDGRPFKMPLYDPEMGALTDLVVGAMGSGKSVFLLTVLIAERLSGVVSLVADAQSGMSCRRPTAGSGTSAPVSRPWAPPSPRPARSPTTGRRSAPPTAGDPSSWATRGGW